MATTLLSIGKAAQQLGVSVDSLRRWDRAGRLKAIRSGPRGHRYYGQTELDRFLGTKRTEVSQWASNDMGLEPPREVYCPTRDVFQARLERFQSELGRAFSNDVTSLLGAITGEIGNNSFDHNLGNWPDIPGIYFSYNLEQRVILLADRGRGILTTLKQIKPELATAEEALTVAFTETISGRYPEARGNGLKFVRSIIVQYPFTLYFQTGNASLFLKQHDRNIKTHQATEFISGCLAIIEFKEAT